jgi:hypothetical protein
MFVLMNNGTTSRPIVTTFLLCTRNATGASKSPLFWSTLDKILETRRFRLVMSVPCNIRRECHTYNVSLCYNRIAHLFLYSIEAD